MRLFRLPDLGEGLQEAEIVAWHVAAGDRVVADQPLLSVETDKAVVEIPCPQSGRIERLCADVGDLLPVGAPLVEFAADAADSDADSLVGELPAATAATPPAEPKSVASTDATAGIRAAPAVRARARKLGIELAGLSGTGPDGALTMADVDAAAAGTGVEPLRGLRRWMARAHAEVVPATVTDEADVDAWWAPDAAVSQRLIRALCAGCRAEPALNAWFDADGESRRLHQQVNLGIAVDMPQGLIVPVLRAADSGSAEDLADRLAALLQQAAARTLAREDVRDATITLSNFGTLAGRHAALVVLPPQVAIVGAGRAGPQVRVHDGAAAVRVMLPLSLTFDHRAVTGGEAARFLATMIADLERAE